MNERELIEHIRQLTQPSGNGLIQGIGDDCAVIEKDRETVWLLTMDTLIESVHFNCTWHPPELLGRKAVAVNISDIAAMGGRPLFVLLSLGLPVGFSTNWTSQLMRGITNACAEQGCLLIGGDTVCSPAGVHLTLTVIGEMRKEQVLYRHGAEIDDVVWVSGPLGWSAAGLSLLQAGNVADDPQWQQLIQTHLTPQPRTKLGQLLAETGLVHAMMDMSDGLATDLAHICGQSGVGATIKAHLLPGGSALVVAGELLGQDPLTWMVSGGEDYELLFTSAETDSETLQRLVAEQGLTVHPIGTIRQGQGLRLIRSSMVEENISFQGFDHFKKGERSCTGTNAGSG
ncbi:MAG: thiamine-phosphate kinase [Candidatus Electronema aureum]|uniref:Thiamine-monophosphate kinase n=1 Tax=Candidatus Electronema aureum TaxID=2005002 RepID=A0A521G273_9BACT|nr:MAG: thiamine-phosphate kinase [Candidatus Electronema aureum]